MSWAALTQKRIDWYRTSDSGACVSRVMLTTEFPSFGFEGARTTHTVFDLILPAHHHVHFCWLLGHHLRFGRRNCISYCQVRHHRDQNSFSAAGAESHSFMDQVDTTAFSGRVFCRAKSIWQCDGQSLNRLHKVCASILLHQYHHHHIDCQQQQNHLLGIQYSLKVQRTITLHVSGSCVIGSTDKRRSMSL